MGSLMDARMKTPVVCHCNALRIYSSTPSTIAGKLALKPLAWPPYSVKSSFCNLSLSKRPNRHLNSASQELPMELLEDSKFVPLDKDDPRYGPPVLLLLGFKHEGVEKIQSLLKDMGGEFLKIILCTPDMIKMTLWDAVHVQQTDLKNVKAADGTPRICFISGLDGEETMMFIDSFDETGLNSTVFAALVPNSAGQLLEELIEEIMGDHEKLSGQQQQD